jgi:hypothetical protein
MSQRAWLLVCYAALALNVGNAILDLLDRKPVAAIIDIAVAAFVVSVGLPTLAKGERA